MLLMVGGIMVSCKLGAQACARFPLLMRIN